MNLNVNINFPNIEKPILISSNFFSIVCQKEVGTIGRNTLPPNIIKRFKEIFYPPQQTKDIAPIYKEINNSFYQPGEEKVRKEKENQNHAPVMNKFEFRHADPFRKEIDMNYLY